MIVIITDYAWANCKTCCDDLHPKLVKYSFENQANFKVRGVSQNISCTHFLASWNVVGTAAYIFRGGGGFP